VTNSENLDAQATPESNSQPAAPVEASSASSAASANKSHYNAQFLFDAPAAAPVSKPSLAARAKQAFGKSNVVVALTGGIVGGVIVAVTGFGISSLSGSGVVIVNNSGSVNWVTAAAAKAAPSVVTIEVSGNGTGGSGSGVVLTSTGYILTNTHVVTLEGATGSPKIEVKTSDGTVYDATVIGTDPTNDLAVIKVNPLNKLTPINFADSSKINAGDSVIAIGAPLGLDATVTSGIVSALDRTIQPANSAAPENGSSGSGGLQFYNGNGGAPINIHAIQTTLLSTQVTPVARWSTRTATCWESTWQSRLPPIHRAKPGPSVLALPFRQTTRSGLQTRSWPPARQATQC
jgi:S1-C subfamily serine protease